MKKRSGSDRPRKRRSNKRPAADSRRNAPGAMRLNKILAAAGLGSRREVEELIVQGRVEIDREVVTDLACKVDPKEVSIKVDGVVLKREKLVYYALNKPPGVLSTNRDPDGRMRVVDLVPDTHRVFSVGRLDRSSEGLMLLTNDGDLAQRLAHPKFGVQKMYFVVVAGIMSREELEKLHKGVYLAEGMARIDGAAVRRQRKGCTELEIVLSEGKNREIRRILARAGHKVVLLRRIAIGPLRLGLLPVGASRLLTPAEVRGLYAATEHPVAKPKKKSVPKGKPYGPAAKSKVAPTNQAAIDDDEALFPMGAGEDWDEDTDSWPASIAPRGSLNSSIPGFDDEDEDSGEYAVGEFDLSSLQGSFDSDEDDDDSGDDDFVGHFPAASSTGSVLGYDDDQDTDQTPRSKRPARTPATERGNSGATERGGRRSEGKRGMSSAPRPTGRKGSKFAKKGAAKRSGGFGAASSAGGSGVNSPPKGRTAKGRTSKGVGGKRATKKGPGGRGRGKRK